jgi:signal transduction histidine kinase
MEGPDRAITTLPADDLSELLGNILENASKWAKNRITLTITQGTEITISIEDDGPGVALEQIEALGQRGIRLDQRQQGYGLGLAIARDILDAYQGEIAFLRSTMGGLTVRLTLPQA